MEVLNIQNFSVLGVDLNNLFENLFSYVILWLYTEFQCSAVPGTYQKVWYKPPRKFQPYVHLNVLES